ncbi:MAG: transcriptional repressor [Myxococcales bacterium]|nr:transcriptional repressor [Myxococcales bacterium]|tara:strand:- start:424 stop:912 length:489 start_codon:yes stop_codon:yes gene_type:complete
MGTNKEKSVQEKVEQRMAQLRAYVSANQMKSTRQREKIAEIFFGSSDHLSAEDLLLLVRQSDASISLATVYRTLKLLVDSNLAESRNFGGDGQTRFEVVDDQEDHHDHLICLSCGKIVEFVNEEIEQLQDKVAASFGFTVTRHKMELYGYCSSDNCEKSQKK